MNAEKDTKEERLSSTQRWLELLVIPAMLLLFVYLLLHQRRGTGFFTAAFGPLEMFCLYGPIFFALIPPVIRAMTGRRNPARPFDAAMNLFLAAGSLWLVITFPFDFSHLADILPGPARFLLAWMGNGIGRLLLILQAVLGPVTAIPAILKYFSVRRQEMEANR